MEEQRIEAEVREWTVNDRWLPYVDVSDEKERWALVSEHAWARPGGNVAWRVFVICSPELASTAHARTLREWDTPIVLDANRSDRLVVPDVGDTWIVRFVRVDFPRP